MIINFRAKYNTTMMESTVAISFLFIVFIYTVKKLVRGNHSSHLSEIPGPKRFPIIGNLHLLLGKPQPHRVFRDLAAKFGPLMRLQLGEVPFLIVSSAEAAKQVLKTHDVVLANRMPMLASSVISYNYKDIVAAPYGEHWRHLRKICTLELLSGRRVRSFRRIREEENLNLAKWIASNAGSPANLSERLDLSSFAIIFRATVGERARDGSRFTWAIHESMKLGSGFSIVDLFPSNRLLPLISGMNFKIGRIFKVTDGILQSIIEQRRAAMGDGVEKMERTEELVDVLLKYHKHDEDEDEDAELTTDTIKAVILDMFFAGSDTSANTVGWAMSEMMKNPRTLKRAQDEVREVLDGKGYVDEDMFEEMKFLKLVIKETLRLHPPLPLLIPRMSSERCEINGYEIPANTRVLVNAWALGRDPEHWKEAEKFLPERFEEDSISSSFDFKGNNFEYIPFGSGRRICPGMTFGIMNVEFTLATLLYHFDWEMPFGMKNDELDMTEDSGVTVKRKRDLLLIPTVTRPLPQLH